jgi:tetratricopeptide (TPR) repeat protein
VAPSGPRWRSVITAIRGEQRHWLVYLLLASAALGAYSLWEASQRGDQIRSVLDEIEFTTALKAESDATINELLAYDLRLLPRYAAALHARQAMLEAKDWEEAGKHDAERRVLGAFFALGFPSDAEIIESDLPVYDTGFVSNRLELYSWERLGQRIEGLKRDLPPQQSQQSSLLWGALAFALSLAAATFGDLSIKSRWFITWATVSCLSLAAGVVILFVNASGSLWVLGVALATLVLLRLGIGRLVPQMTKRNLSWYAELAGSVTVVVLTVVVIFLSGADRNEGNALNAARLRTAEATEQLLTDQQAALDDLDATMLVESLRARFEQVTRDTGSTTIDVPGGVTALLSDGIEDRRDGPTRGDATNTLNTELSEGGTGFVGDHLNRNARGSLQMLARAELDRVEAAVWGEKVARHTIALVLLGLAAYMFSLAADNERHRFISAWVLTGGVVGLALGTALSLTSLGQPNKPEMLEEVAEHYADGRIALLTRQCDEAVESFSEAIATFDAAFTADVALRAAYIDRAVAANCVETTVGVYSPGMSDERLDAFLADVAQASRADLESEVFLGTRAWGEMLRGLQESDPESLQRAAAFTGRALQRDRSNPYFLYNQALIQLAQGNHETARESYRLAARCVLRKDSDDPEPCLGEERQDDSAARVFAIQALGDLQMLEANGIETDHYRELVMETLLGLGGSEPDPAALTSLAVFPLELQLSAESIPAGQISIVWYHRPAGRRAWGVLESATFTTLRSAQFDVPVEAFMALPPGEYMAEVYVEGRLAGSIETNTSGAGSARRYAWHDLGVQAALPDWVEVVEQQGFSREYQDRNDPSRRIIVMRSEGWPAATAEFPLSLDLDLLTELVFGREVIGEDGTETYFLGIDRSSITSRTYDEGNIWSALGFSSYCEEENSPGTIIGIWIEGAETPDDPWRSAIIDSLDLIGGTAGLLSAEDCEVGGNDVAFDDTAHALENRPVVVDVLANESTTFTYDPATLVIVDDPDHGQVVIDEQSMVTYTPEPGFVGDDFFAYDVCDSAFEVCDQATVTVSVVPATIVDLIGAPTDQACGDNTVSASGWPAIGMPEPIEIWRCDYPGTAPGVDLFVEFYRFGDTATANLWSDLQIGRQTAPSDEVLYDGTWHRGEEGPTQGRLREWVSTSSGTPFSVSLWVYESEAIVGFAWATTSDHAVVRDWWVDKG